MSDDDTVKFVTFYRDYVNVWYLFNQYGNLEARKVVLNETRKILHRTKVQQKKKIGALPRVVKNRKK